MMSDVSELNFFNNFSDAVFVLQKEAVAFVNSSFIKKFPDFKSFESFKKHFNFDLCFLSFENLRNKTPLDLLIKTKENFHSTCIYQNTKGEYFYFYIYKFVYKNYSVVVFKDITDTERLKNSEKQNSELKKLYQAQKSENEKYYKLQEHAQTQVLKMGIVNRISLIIRETNDMETVLSCALTEIHNLLGSFKTYFSMKDKTGFKIMYSVSKENTVLEQYTDYEPKVLSEIKDKNIVVNMCLKEFLNSEEILKKGSKRIIIPVYNKNKLLGIIVTLTRQKFNIEDNKEILQSISVQLASAIIQSGLITQLNKKNVKLQKTLNELKETQMQLINTEKMASLGQLISGVAHEINTPLSSINSNSNLIKKIIGSDSELSAEKINLIKEMNDIEIEAVERISDIVKSLKKFVRLDEAEFQKADINSEIDLTLKLIEHETKNCIKIIKNYGELPPVMCSVNMLNQVFMNILVNACHSIKETGRTGEITITTEVSDSKLVVKIKDNGAGISSSIQNKIFNAGFTTKKSGLGTGLGLAISKKIIELHKGSITFKSTENVGTEFQIAIPVKTE